MRSQAETSRQDFHAGMMLECINREGTITRSHGVRFLLTVNRLVPIWGVSAQRNPILPFSMSRSHCSSHSRYIYNPCYTPCRTPRIMLPFCIKQTKHTGQSISLAITKGKVITVDK